MELREPEEKALDCQQNEQGEVDNRSLFCYPFLRKQEEVSRMQGKEKLLSLLYESGDGYASGNWIAKELGMTRAAVW